MKPSSYCVAMLGTWKIPIIAKSEITPLISELMDIVRGQSGDIQALKDEIARLKGLKGKPKIKPSGLEKGTGDDAQKSRTGKRPGSEKSSKTGGLEIDEDIVLHPENIPSGSVLKEYRDFIVQDLEMKKKNTRYRIAVYATPEGGLLSGSLPVYVDGHFGAELKSFILYQYHQCHVTQPLLLEELREFGIEISSGHLNSLLTLGHENFHSEKLDLLKAGLLVSSYVSVDDTGARHQGKNGVCTQIGNDLFAWFETTESKSRLNFLKLLCAEKVIYFVNEYALQYVRKKHGLFTAAEALKKNGYERDISTEVEWESLLDQCGVRGVQARLAITEGALLGYLVDRGLPPDFVILSDDAGQFNILLHALCWVHAERHIFKLLGNTEAERLAIAKVRGEVWDLYRDLKTYKTLPTQAQAEVLQTNFDRVFSQKTCSLALNSVLERLNRNKNELLLVLKNPTIPLNTNSSETDIREYTKRRKISGSTRSADGRKSRDTFISLKKTCRKLGVSFWKFLNDRVAKLNGIPALADLIRDKAGGLALVPGG